MFKIRSVNRNYTNKMLNKMLEFKKREIKNSRTEQLSKYQNELKQQKSFDKSLCNQKERISSTGKSHVRSFQKINERRKWEWELELENILKELDND